MKNVLRLFSFLLAIILSCQFAIAQTGSVRYQRELDSLLKNWGTAGSFTIKGSVKNSAAKFFEFAMTDYIENNAYSVVIKNDGTFEQKFPVMNSQQIYLYLNDNVLTFTVSDKDTIQINWDEKNFKNSFKIASPQPIKNVLLQTELTLYHNYRQPFLELMRGLNKNKTVYTSDQKFDLINAQYNQIVKTIINIEKNNPDLEKSTISKFNDLIIGEYFTYADLLRQENLLYRPLTIIEDSTFKLPFKEATFNNKTQRISRFPILERKNAYKLSDERYFSDVPNYRSFINGYIRASRLFNGSTNIIRYKMGETLPKTNFTEQLYYMGKANFNTTYGSVLIGDWFITKSIVEGFGIEDFSNVEIVYNKFLAECKTAYFKDVLTKTYTAIKNLKPGLVAPDFTLKNEAGQTVSLTDFKGKVVYIDFWGVDCGPCIYEFKEFTPKLHARYKDKEVVFLNICVDSNEKQWKKGIQQYDVKGINLIAEGWGKNPVCIAYNITGIPHYLIINKDGTIANNNAPRPSDIMGIINNKELDIALKKP